MKMAFVPGVLLVALGAAGCSAHPKPTPNPDGFSRADRFAGAVPVVTTRLHRLDKRGFPKNLPATREEACRHSFVPANAWEELDDIYGLMALAVVDADWQEAGSPRARGHNIGGVVVDDKLEVVNWERNSNEAMCNGTQHGEVRMMLKQLNRTGSSTLKRFQIYTSLEPCMMCSGMMMQQGVLRTLYMQTDNAFGKNIERLTIDTSAVPVRFDEEDTHQHGYPPAARPVISSMSSSEFRVELDVAWRAASTGKVQLTEWLRSAEAKDIYARARAKFEKYQLRFPTETATARFIVPQGATNARMAAEKDFVALEAAKTNAELYAAALHFFNDPARAVIPYFDPDGDGPRAIEEDRQNVFATRLLEDPSALVRGERPRGEVDGSVPPIPKQDRRVVDGTFEGRRIHQERVRLECPRAH